MYVIQREDGRYRTARRWGGEDNRWTADPSASRVFTTVSGAKNSANYDRYNGNRYNAIPVAERVKVRIVPVTIQPQPEIPFT